MNRLLSMLLPMLFAMLLASSGPARAAERFIPPMPLDFDQVDVYLVTIGRGEYIHAIFGHTILRVVDRKNKLDMNFNWGIFDFNDPSFIWNFYVGNLNYMMEITDFRTIVDGYKDWEHRRVTQERINLTGKQKERLLRRLIWNAQPENIHYQYKQTRDNCATKPRDYLDEAVGGNINKAYGARPGRTGFRPFIRDGARQFWWADIGMDMLINSSYDVPLTYWEEMFLPAKLREHLMNLPAYDDAGLPIAGTNLLSGTQTIVDLPEPRARRDAYFAIALVMLLPMAGLWWTRAAYASQTSRRWLRALGLVTVLFGLWSAFFGTSMTTNWLISRYTETWADANLWLMWPVDWFFVVWGAKVALTGTVRPEPSRWAKVARGLSLAHVVGVLVLAALWAFGIVRQDVTPVLASTGLAALLLYGLLYGLFARRTA